MAGGDRQGSPGKSYSNRTDLNIDRAPQPGSSGTMPPVPQGQQGPAPLLPDDIPNLDVETQFPDEPVTSGMPFGEGPNIGPTPPAFNATLLQAALRRNPGDPDLRRLAAYTQVRAM